MIDKNPCFEWRQGKAGVRSSCTCKGIGGIYGCLIRVLNQMSLGSGAAEESPALLLAEGCPARLLSLAGYWPVESVLAAVFPSRGHWVQMPPVHYLFLQRLFVLLIQTKDEENTDLQLLLPNIKRHVDTCTYQSAFSGFVFGLYLPLFLWVYSSLVLSMAESPRVWIPQKTWTWLPLWQINSHYSERYSWNKELFTGLSMMLHPQDRSSVL